MLESRKLLPGLYRETLPIAPLEASMVRIPAGPVEFGVEYRVLNSATASLEGSSIHVYGRGSGEEFLRFDMFPEDPHYHYIVPGVYHLAVRFDDVANGPFFDWVVERLRSSLPAMLAEARAVDLADEVARDYEAVLSALPEVLTVLREEPAQEVAREQARR